MARRKRFGGMPPLIDIATAAVLLDYSGPPDYHRRLMTSKDSPFLVLQTRKNVYVSTAPLLAILANAYSHAAA